MTDAERRALELYPPQYIRETWKRTEPDINAPLRDAYVKGRDETIERVCAYLNDALKRYESPNKGATLSLRLIQNRIDIINNISNFE